MGAEHQQIGARLLLSLADHPLGRTKRDMQALSCQLHPFLAKLGDSLITGGAALILQQRRAEPRLRHRAARRQLQGAGRGEIQRVQHPQIPCPTQGLLRSAAG